MSSRTRHPDRRFAPSECRLGAIRDPGIPARADRYGRAIWVPALASLGRDDNRVLIFAPMRLRLQRESRAKNWVPASARTSGTRAIPPDQALDVELGLVQLVHRLRMGFA